MKDKRLETIYALPLMCILAVIPLVTFITVYHTDIGNNTWITGTAFYDFFLYYKSQLLMLTGLILGVTTAVSLLRGYHGNLYGKNSYYALIPVGIFALFSFVSAMASEHRADALFGGYEQFEGLFVLLCYVFCYVFAYIYVTDGKWLDLLLYTLLIGSLILSFTGAMQAFHWDYMTNKKMIPFLTMFLKNVPEKFSISASFGKGVSYATLYNPNYVGTYVALVLPVTVALGLWGRKLVFRILAAVSALFQIIMLFGAQSMTGLIGVAGGALIALLFLFADLRKNRRLLFGIGGVLLVAITGVLVGKPDLLARFTQTTISSCNYTVSSIETSNDAFQISLDSGKTIEGRIARGKSIHECTLYDSAGSPLPTVGTLAAGLTIPKEEYKGIAFFSDSRQFSEGEKTINYDILRISAGENYSWELLKRNDKLYYVNGVGKLDRLRKVNSLGFEHRYDLATNRGYIWSRTLPLLQENMLLGKGADNFVYAFPNDDYVGKINCGFGSQTITKPHNMYMQIWVQDGMPACLAFLAIFVLFAIRTFRGCFKKGTLTYTQKIQIAVFCGAAGYMTAGIANDSTICVAPVFWCLLGIGMAVSCKNWQE